MKVIFLSKYGYNGASSRYRFYNYRQYFEDFEYEFHPLLSDDYLNELYSSKKSLLRLLYLKIIDIIKRIAFLITSSSDNFYIIEKELFPNVPFIIEKLLLSNKRYALDYDDYTGTSYKLTKLKKIFLENKLNNLVERSVFTTVGNRWYFKEFGTANLFYLPTVIDIDLYESVHDKKNKKNVSDPVTIVWIGSASTLKYLEIIKSPFMRLSKKYNLRLLVIGGKPPFLIPNMTHVKWSEADEILNLVRGDIGIMPLYDTLWEKGKCGFKLIQYMGAGLPVLASPSPANCEIIDNNGFICDNEDDWYNHLEQLIIDENLRARLGSNSFQRAKSFYSYQIWGEFYCKLISKSIKP